MNSNWQDSVCYHLRDAGKDCDTQRWAGTLQHVYKLHMDLI